MKPVKASVYVVCRDEERHIGRLLENIKDFDEVVLVDSGSTDATLEIAKQYPNVTIYSHPWLGYAGQKAFALGKCTNLWVLNLDADETISDTLKEEIRKAIDKDHCDALSCRLSEIVLGKPQHPLSKHADKVRFFKKTCGRYDLGVSVHESISVKGKTRRVKGVIYDHGLSSIEVMTKKSNLYSTLGASDKFKRGKRAKNFKLISVFFWAFFRAYVLKRLLLNGTRGFIHSMSIGFYAFLKEAKLYELAITSDKPDQQAEQ